MPIDLSIHLIKKRQKLFEDEFYKCFKAKLQEYHDVAVGIKNAEIKYSFIGSIAKDLGESIISGVVSSAPIVGPFISSFITSIPKQIYEYYKEQQLKQKATHQNEILIDLGNNIIESVIEETAREITRIFEYQLVMLKGSTEVEKLAEFAVNKIFKYAESNSGSTAFNRNDMIKALVADYKFSIAKQIQLAAMSDHIIFTQDGVQWNIHNIFSKPGLREEIDHGLYKFKVKVDSLSKHIKYGYRSKILFWDEVGETFIASVLDEDYIKDPPNNAESLKASSYIPLMRLVSQNEFDEYYNHFLPSKRVIGEMANFNQFFYDNLNTGKIAVFRNIKIAAGSNLQNSDFSNTDMTKIVLQNIDLRHCIFTNSWLILAKITASTFDRSELKLVDLRWSSFFTSHLKGDTILIQVNFDYAFIDKETDFTDNIHFIGVSKQYTRILTDKIHIRIYERFEKQEEMINQIQCEQQRQILIKQKSLQANNFYNVRGMVDGFIGREAQLTHIHEYFVQHKNGIQVIGGIGGIGKTQATLCYINQHEQMYDFRVRWFTAESKATLDIAFREFAQTLGLAIEKLSDEDIIKWVKEKLANQIDKSLLVFDNVEDYELIEQYLPEPGKKTHHVIITARYIKAWEDASIYFKSNIIELNPFSEEEALQYITRNIPNVLQKEALLLAKLFDNIPLGLSQSIAYIRNNAIDVETYLMKYKHLRSDQPTQLLTSLHDNKYALHKQDIYTTLSMTLTSLSSIPKAIEVLKLCSYLNAENIPEYLFDSLFSSQIERNKIIAILRGYSLISIKFEAGIKFIYIHRIVQEVAKISIGEDILLLFKQVAELVHNQMADCTNTWDALAVLKKNQPMLKHAVTLINYYNLIDSNSIALDLKDSIDRKIVELYQDCGNLFSILQQLSLAQMNYEDALRIAKRTYGDKHSKVAVIIHAIGNIYLALGKSKDARAQYEESLQIKKLFYGDEHLGLVSRNPRNFPFMFITHRFLIL